MPLSSISTDGNLVVTWTLSAPAAGVWAGFKDPRMLSQWLGQPIECDLRPGGRLIIDHGGGYLSRSAITEAKKPHRLLMTWEFPDEPQSRIGIELRPADAETVVELTHHGLGDLVDSYGPGWITHLTFLEAAVAEAPIPTSHFWSLYASFESLVARRKRGVPQAWF